LEIVRKALKDILAGSVFICFGLFFALVSLTYELGSPLNMGPGYLPLVLGGVLALLGIAIVAKGFVAGEGDSIGTIPWRSAALIAAAVIFFGFTVRGLGLVPSLFITTVMTAFAGHRVSVIPAVVIAAGLTILCVLIFFVGLQLRVPLIGPWIPV
jgi:putative tricarboxylic transport membrane protein